MSQAIKKIAINTGGGDAPGLNAVIHGAVYAARGFGWEIVGIREGYDGLLEPERFPDGGLMNSIAPRFGRSRILVALFWARRIVVTRSVAS